MTHFETRSGKQDLRFKADWRPLAEQKADRPFTTPQVLWLGEFSADNRTLVSCANEFVYVWDVETGKLRRKIRRSHKWGSYLAVSPDGKTLATSDYRSADDYGTNAIRVYDLDTGEELLSLDPGDDRAVVLAFSPDGAKLFSGFHRGSATVWDIRRPKSVPGTN